MGMPTGRTTLRFTGHGHLRQRLILSVLSGRPVRIDDIRVDDVDPGIREHEASFLRLLERLTNGTVVEISFSGTSIVIRPGVISGGKVQHDCGLERSIGFFLEMVILLAPFAKTPFDLTLLGITTSQEDLSVDLLRTVTLPTLRLFGIEDSATSGTALELRILKRGSRPKGGGEVRFLCPTVRSLKVVNIVSPGRIRKIRGIAWATRTSPQMANRMVETCRGVLNTFIPDIYIYTDVYKGAESGKSPGYGLSLVAESTTGVLYSAELCSEPQTEGQKGSGHDGSMETGTPEDLGKSCARSLLTAISQGGCVDRNHQFLAILGMVLGPEDVGRVRLGELSPKSIQLLRDVRDVFGTTFRIRQVDDEDKYQYSKQYLLSCVGTGHVNVSKKAG